MKSLENFPDGLLCRFSKIKGEWTFANGANAIQNGDFVSYPARNVLWICNGDVIAANNERLTEDLTMCAARSSPQRRASDLAARDRIVMQEIEKEQEARDKKTARLRALRLAKEAADKEHSEKEEAKRLADAEQALKPSGKKSTRPRQRSAAGKAGSAERPTQHG